MSRVFAPHATQERGSIFSNCDFDMRPLEAERRICEAPLSILQSRYEQIDYSLLRNIFT
jgi:hypothetical protein